MAQSDKMNPPKVEKKDQDAVYKAQVKELKKKEEK